MLVTEMLKLALSPQGANALLATTRACNAGASRAAEVAFEHIAGRAAVMQPDAARPAAASHAA
jgi:hypothetical protein